jgi:hypothetical protein
MNEDIEKINDDFEKKGYTDGLPIIPPTRARVNKMLEWTDRKRDDSLGRVPPSEDEVTVEVVAINAVMAGCKPEYFPVVITEIEALLDRPNLRGALATTAQCWPLAIVNGPIAKEIGLHSGWGLLGTGPQHRANLSIGRTMTLVIQNVGKSIPGISEKKHLWNLGRIGICFPENEDLIPPSWDPLHVEKGFRKETSTVTVFDEGRLYETQVGGGRPSGIFEIDMRRIAKRLVNLHYNPPLGVTPRGEASLYICTPSKAKIYADHGWTKQGLKEFFFENCRSKPEEWFLDYPENIRNDIMRTSFAMEPPWIQIGEFVPLFRSPDDLWVVVSGPDGNPTDVWALSIHHGGHPAII